MERRVALLSPQSLDLDMLEERARIVLNYGRESEVVVLVSPPNQPAPRKEPPSGGESVHLALAPARAN
jgi:hypothetical protein